MKKAILLIAMACLCKAGFSQSGPIAHWTMDSTVTDVTGNGHDGIPNNLTPDVGMDGVMGHGYHFNGVDSWIGVPSSPSFNLLHYTICATVRIDAFYTGLNQTSVILARGGTGPTGFGTYELVMNDKPGDGYDAYTYDTTVECFFTGSCASGTSLSPSATTDFNYTPHVANGQWYKIVATFDDTAYRLYINDTLKNTALLLYPGMPMGTSDDSISIGYSLYDAWNGCPYPLNGIIDDIMLFDRVLNDSEIAAYRAGCGGFTTHPATAHLPHGGNASYTVVTSMGSPVYQWQVNSGTGFTNLANVAPYSGVHTPTLSVSGATSSMNYYQYRCIVSNSVCADTSLAAALLTGISDLDLNAKVSIYPTPARNTLNLNVQDLSGSATVAVYNAMGQLLVTKTLGANLNTIDVTNLSPGTYQVMVTVNGQTIVRKISKL